MRSTVSDIKKLLLKLLFTEILFALLLITFNYLSQTPSFINSFPYLNNLSLEHKFHIATIIELLIIIGIFVEFILTNTFRTNSIKLLLEKDESDKLEFKSSLRWDYNNSSINKDLEDIVAKIVVGFLNTKGGILLIGISDDKKVMGIEKDIESLPKKNPDSFIRHLTQIINQKIGINYSRYIKIKIVKYLDKLICKIDVNPSLEPSYLKKKEEDEFYIRIEALTKALKLSEAVRYIEMHWD